MKALWAIILVLVAIAVVVLFQPARATRDGTAATDAMQAEIEKGVEATLAAPPVTTSPAPSDAAPKPVTPAAALASDLNTERAQAALDSSAVSARPLKAGAVPKDASIDATPIEFSEGLDRTIKNATVEKGAFGRTPDGALLADNRWIVRGKGTQESPYIVSWDYLLSAMDSYQPRNGQNAMPQRIAMLDGKWVTVEGFFIFPLASTEVKQSIIAMNRWDGCCIGVPPTAYDAIEATLLEPMALNRAQHQILYGQATGIFRVEPYVIDSWLVGLYLLDGATMRAEL
ncbi:MAG: hypothetical protein JNM94_06370 [Phycisphaerae bacterium]|nr:hypothetical protein [Phycisphaerae bacterium]